ncbi:MAG: hypothetical protein KDD15_30605 [Lewinella sp.]|nr:hypothetical protein [Lewinella sp.]
MRLVFYFPKQAAEPSPTATNTAARSNRYRLPFRPDTKTGNRTITCSVEAIRLSRELAPS